MKAKTSHISFTLIVISLILVFCSKPTNSKKVDISRHDTFLSIPGTVPTISNNIELYAQLRHLASFMAGLVDNGAVNVWGADNMMITLGQNISTGEDYIPIMSYHNYMSTTAPGFGYKFSINGASPSNPNTSDLYEAFTHF